MDSNIESILTEFLKIVELSSVSEQLVGQVETKTKQDTNKEQILDKSEGTLGVESLQIETNSNSIIRQVEELLSITRNLKESWILGQIPTVQQQSSEMTEGLDVKMNSLLKLVIGDDLGVEGVEVQDGVEEIVDVETEVVKLELVSEEKVEEQSQEQSQGLLAPEDQDIKMEEVLPSEELASEDVQIKSETNIDI